MSFEESFLYPASLLILGAGLSTAVSKWVSQKWHNEQRKREDRQKELEIKRNLTSRINESMSTLSGTMSFAVGSYMNEDKRKYFQEWAKQCSEIGSDIRSNFYGNDSLIDGWNKIYRANMAFFLLFERITREGTNTEDDGENHVKKIRTNIPELTNRESLEPIIEEMRHKEKFLNGVSDELALNIGWDCITKFYSEGLHNKSNLSVPTEYLCDDEKSKEKGFTNLGIYWQVIHYTLKKRKLKLMDKLMTESITVYS